MELTADPTDPKPVMTRKLRRRPNDPLPMPEKRRKPPPSQQLHYLLDERDVDDDLKVVSKALSADFHSTHTVPETTAKIEDGKLMYERKWFHRGQPVFVEGDDMPRFAAVVSAISSEEVCVKKVSDGTKVRVSLSQLLRGKASFRRRAS